MGSHLFLFTPNFLHALGFDSFFLFGDKAFVVLLLLSLLLVKLL